MFLNKAICDVYESSSLRNRIDNDIAYADLYDKGEIVMNSKRFFNDITGHK